MLQKELSHCLAEFDEEIEFELGKENRCQKHSTFEVRMRFHSRVINHHKGVVSPTFNARCDWLGNFDVDLYELDNWQPLNKGALFAWWWHHLAITEIERDKNYADLAKDYEGVEFSRDEPKWINKLKEQEADRILKARGIKAEHE